MGSFATEWIAASMKYGLHSSRIKEFSKKAICYCRRKKKTLIPFDGYYVYVYFWNDEYAKRLVECLLPIYSKMIVDDDNGNIVSGANYLKTKYIHNFLHARKGEYYNPNNKHK